MVQRSWKEILATHYRHKAPQLLKVVRHYSLHYFYVFEERRYVLSQVRRDDRRIPFRFQFDITELLSGRTRMVRRPEPPADARRPWVEGEEHYWFVRAYTEHDPAPDWRDPGLVRDAALKLAHVHDISKGLPSDFGGVQGGLAPYHWTVQRVLAQRDDFVACMEKRCSREDIAVVRRNLDELAGRAAGIELGLTGITHQDFRPGNILVRDGAVTEIIDWDLAHEDHYLYDAVLGALHLGLPAARTFMDTYRYAVDVKADRAALDWMFRYVPTRNLAVSRSPAKWRTLLDAVSDRTGSCLP